MIKMTASSCAKKKGDAREGGRERKREKKRVFSNATITDEKQVDRQTDYFIIFPQGNLANRQKRKK